MDPALVGALTMLLVWAIVVLGAVLLLIEAYWLARGAAAGRFQHVISCVHPKGNDLDPVGLQ
ncbi:hypothetical protein ACFQS2_04520 [Brachybacterium sp. GCM10030267]|uniref:hypothetical protein n=1 Tax=unclassified Brachybacterium TaxID=2623841 RepID=UPI00360A254E